MTVLAVLGATGCLTTTFDGARVVELQYGQTSFCPLERVHATEETELAVMPSVQTLTRPTPWVEPTPPEGVAGDAERLRLWKIPRDAQYAAWRSKNEQSDPATSPVFAAYRQRQIYAVRGCGATRLYVCGPSSRGREHVCSDIHDNLASDRVVCRNGGVLRASNDGEAIRFACGAPESPAPDPVTVAATCLAACDEGTCASACSDTTGCELHCKIEASRCRAGCSKTAHEAVAAKGLCGVGLCDHFAAAEEAEHATGERLAEVSATIDQQVAATAGVRAEARANEQCNQACLAADRCGSSLTCVQRRLGCLLTCAQVSRARCESVAPASDWCAGFRSNESSFEEAFRRNGGAPRP